MRYDYIYNNDSNTINITTYNLKRIFNGTNIHFSIDGVAYDFKNTIQHILMTTDMSIPSRSKGKYSFNSINLMPI